MLPQINFHIIQRSTGFISLTLRPLSSKNTHMEWRASHILVKDCALAQQLLRQIKQGGRFKTLAKEHSTFTSRSSGGNLGWFGPGKMVGQFEAACKRMSPGSVSDVVLTQFGYHIIKLTGCK